MIIKSIIAGVSLLIAFFISPIYAAETTVTVERIESQGNQKRVQIKLTNTNDNTPVTLDKLKEAHTRKVHVMIIDDSLRDYSHVHPQPTKVPGVYEFEWQPKKTGSHYRLWADLVPVSTGKQEYITTDLSVSANSKAVIDKITELQKTVDNLTFTLSFDTPDLQVGKAAMGNIRIVDSNGQPVKNLEPLMGAFAHIVGFEDDFKTIVHMHPMGEEPTKTTDRGGPEFQFHLELKKAGFMRLFAQFKIQGKEVFVPFGVIVNPA
jgi:hypothetical protein